MTAIADKKRLTILFGTVAAALVTAGIGAVVGAEVASEPARVPGAILGAETALILDMVIVALMPLAKRLKALTLG